MLVPSDFLNNNRGWRFMKFVNLSAPEQLFFDQLGGNIMPLYRAYGNVNSFNNLGVKHIVVIGYATVQH